MGLYLMQWLSSEIKLRGAYCVSQVLFRFPKPYSIARVIAEVWYTR